MSDIMSPPPAPPASEPGGGPGAPDESSIRPGKVWYWIGAAVLVLGTVGAIVWFTASVIGIATAADGYARVPLDSSRSLTFNETGSYLVFAEVTSNVTASTVIAEPEVTVTDGAGSSVPVQTYYGNSTYNTGGHHGQAFGRIDVAAPGTYTVEVGRRGSGSGTSRTPIGVAIGKDVPVSGVVGIIGSMILGFVAFVAGVVILVVAGVRRGRSRRRLFPPVPKYAPMAYPGGYRPGPYGPPPGPYGAPPGPYGPPPGPYGTPPGPYGAPPGPYGGPAPGPYGPPPGPFGTPPGGQGPAQPVPPPASDPAPPPGPVGDDASSGPPPQGPWPRPGSGGG